MRTSGFTATVLAGALLLAPAAVAHAAPPVAPAMPATPPEQLLLKHGEFPAGYAVEEPISRTELNKVLRDVGDGIASGRISPAHCRTGFNRADFDDAGQVPVVVAVNKRARSALSEALTTAAGAGAALAPAPGCERVRVEMDRVGGTSDTMALDVSTTMTQVPGAPAGAQIAAVRSTGTGIVDGKRVNVDQEQVVGVSAVRGYSVIVSASSFVPGQKPDLGAFGRTLTAATDKVRGAR